MKGRVSMLNVCLICAGLLLLLPGQAFPDDAPAAALVTAVSGKAEILPGTSKSGKEEVSPGTSKKLKPLSLLTEVSAGDMIMASGNAKVRLVFYGDTHSEVITGPCSVTITASSCEAGKESPASCINRSGPYKGIRNLASLTTTSKKVGASFTRGAPQQIIITGPVGKGIDARPLFSWKKCEGATDYRITIEDQNEKILGQYKTTDCFFRYPDSKPHLELGKRYDYTVSALQDGDVLSKASAGFQLVSKDILNSYENLKKQASEQMQTDPDDKSPLSVLLVFTLDNALYDEAYDICTRLLEDNSAPENVHYVLGVIYKAKNKTAEAEEEFKKAGRKE